MTIKIAEILSLTIFIYIIIGLIFAVYFSFFGVNKIDENAKNSGLGFRLLILPGVIIFWPILVFKLFINKAYFNDNTVHDKLAK